MEKSTTQRKYNFEHAQQVFVEFGTKYLKNWTEQELKKFRTEPVVIPTGKYGFFVGPFKITGIKNNCWAVSRINGVHIHDFVSKANAIIYCLQEVKKQFQSSQDLLVLDTKIGRLEDDMIHYQAILSKKQNNFKYGIVLNRYIDAKVKHRSYLDILKKTLKSAKYLNFGNQTL